MFKKFDFSSTTEQVDGISVQIVKIEGYLDSSTFRQLKDHLQSLIDQEQYRIIVEFGRLNYISSAGLGVLMGMLHEVRDNDGDLKLANMSNKVRNLFDMLGFSRLIRIYDDCEAAKQAFVEDQERLAHKKTVLPEDDY
ncbi:MAG TPA: STAS domain-containing protein [bacterium]|nr:STAS domain-containing protein [Candidatus Omnitrophota bacterium]HOJ58952.1 STAS domain-containing protein [bacterium]HOL95758.1 STAS domain-containing protein [bacterium]HPP00817.1 STAS domain-containing protein [bacterium]HXK94719.1 STAS domain-containing protein [bacterium]